MAHIWLAQPIMHHVLLLHHKKGSFTVARFSPLPALDGLGWFVQPPASGDVSDDTPDQDNIPDSALKRAASLKEGDLVTGTINVTNECAHMLPAIRNVDRIQEKKLLVRRYLPPVDHLT